MPKYIGASWEYADVGREQSKTTAVCVHGITSINFFEQDFGAALVIVDRLPTRR